jgi:two-component system NtrC family sensor kinase
MTAARLLVVADDPALVRLLSSPAAGGAYDVTAIAAVSTLCDHQPCAYDVVIVDLTSCARSGPDAVRQVRRQCPDTEIVIIVSSTTSVASAIASYDLAAFAVVAEPFDGDQLLSTIAQAVERRRINQANRRLMWELKVVNEIGEDLRRSLDPAVLLDAALRRLLNAFEGQAGSVRLVASASGLPGGASIDVGPTAAIAEIAGAHGAALAIERVLATGQAAHVRDFAEMLSVDPAALPIRCATAVPMYAGDEMIGALSLGSTTPARFTADDRQLIQTVGNHLAIAVQNARLHAIARAGKQQWEATFDAISDPIGVFDREGRLLRGNTALAACLGVPITAIRGLSCDDIGLCGAPYPACGVGRPSDPGERAEVTRADGQIFSVTTCPVVADGDGAAVVQIAKNVTQEIRSARRLLHMSEELSEANARLLATVDRLKTTQAQLLQAEKLSAIGQLVAGVAHELNNPLTSVIGYAQLVEEELREDGDAPVRTSKELAHDVRRIAEESERAAKIVRNLLAFARRQTAARAPQDIADLTSRVLSLRSYEFRLNTIEIETAFESGLPRVLADAGQLQQALLNLVLNAEQAMRSRTPKRLRVGARSDADACAVELFVGDTGHGITDENLPRIFDPFFTTRDVGEGTGHGLSICYGIVRDHGGQIAVKSRVGEGTTFSLLLPALDRDPIAVPEPLVVAHGDPVDRDYISAALAGWGHTGEMFDQPDAALARVRGGGVGLAFVERAFVDGEPGAWTEALGAPAQRPPLVLLVRPQADEHGGEQGWKADAVLAPPFELRAVRDVLRAVSRECV